MLKSTLSGFQRCHRQHGSIFIQLTLVASEMCEIPWNSPKIQFKVIQGHRSWCQSKAHMQLLISH